MSNLQKQTAQEHYDHLAHFYGSTGFAGQTPAQIMAARMNVPINPTSFHYLEHTRETLAGKSHTISLTSSTSNDGFFASIFGFLQGIFGL